MSNMLTAAQTAEVNEKGFTYARGLFAPDEIDLLTRAMEEDPAVRGSILDRRDGEGRSTRIALWNRAGDSVYGLAARTPRVVDIAEALIGEPVYHFQSKLTAKEPRVGGAWEWHQDYIFWRNEDGMPAPRAVNATVFLDEVHEFNGPIQVIPGSHTKGVIELQGREGVPSEYSDSPAWISNLTADLKYSIDRSSVARLVRQHGIVAPKGQAHRPLVIPFGQPADPAN